MISVLTLANKEIREGVRNGWVLGATLLLAALALALTFLGAAPTGTISARPLDAVIVSLSTLTILLVPLIALLISYDTIIGEDENGTLLLLVSYPVARRQVLIGKFLGHLAILCLATLVGYGAAIVALFARGEIAARENWLAFSSMIASSVMLGSVLLCIGYLVSISAHSRGGAAGAALGVWLLFVILYDMGLLGLLVVDQGRHITIGTLNLLLLLNPADIYRLYNLSTFADIRVFSGMAGLTRDAMLPAPVLLTALFLWIAGPLWFATAIFERREL